MNLVLVLETGNRCKGNVLVIDCESLDLLQSKKVRAAMINIFRFFYTPFPIDYYAKVRITNL